MVSPAAVITPPVRDASLAPLPSAPADDWMNSRIQRILQRQRAVLEAAPRRPRALGSGLTGQAPRDDQQPPRVADAGAPADVGGVLPAPRNPAPGTVHDQALERRLQRELDETLAEIARVEALSRSVQAQVQTADNRAELQASLQRIEGELRDLRALHRALRDELGAVQGR